MNHHNQTVPVYTLEPDETTGSRQFRLYQFNSEQPDRAELLVPHRKNHYLVAFVRRAEGRQWIDMMPCPLKDNTVYFITPDELIVKEETRNLWSTGIAFTKQFLSQQENTALNDLPLIQNPHKGYELRLSQTDILFVEDMLAKITTEHKQPGE